MKLKDNISWKQLGERIVAVDTAGGDYYTFNEVASTIWVAANEDKSVDDIVAQIMEEYDVTDPEAVRKDVEAQLAQWKEMDLIV